MEKYNEKTSPEGVSEAPETMPAPGCSEAKAPKISQTDYDGLVASVARKFDKYNDARSSQISDMEALRDAIYATGSKNNTSADFDLPDIWELSQTLKSHLIENLYSHPEAMFDVAGATPEAQEAANVQKSMLVSYFEKMDVSAEIEKITDSIVETGEATVLVGWENRVKIARRPQSYDEQSVSPTEDGFVLEEKTAFDGPKVKFVPAQDFVFDPERASNFENAAKIYRTFANIADLKANKLNNLLSEEKLDTLANMLAECEISEDADSEPEKGIKGEQLEILEFWGDITLESGEVLENYLVVVAGRAEIIRLESNPFINQPFVHAAVITDPSTSRGISPLKIALGLSRVSSTILNKQLDALSLIINPPYLAPKGCFKGEQEVSPGKIIEYDAALMPQQPVPLNFSSALQGWDFINFFKNSIESATGIFKTMSGNVTQNKRTATEVNYSAGGQSARLNMIIDAINRKIIVPMVEKTAETLSNFKIGEEQISVLKRGVPSFLTVSDKVRRGEYIYRYGDRKASIERKYRFKELFDIISSFAQRQDFAKNIDFVECFKFALEQYGIENASNFLNPQEPEAPKQATETAAGAQKPKNQPVQGEKQTAQPVMPKTPTGGLPGAVPNPAQMKGAPTAAINPALLAAAAGALPNANPLMPPMAR